MTDINTELLDKLRQYQETGHAIAVFDRGGRITSVSVSVPQAPIEEPETDGPPPDPLPPMLPFAVIDTQDMDYPPQMVAAIQAHLAERRARIASDLEALGVTGLGALTQTEQP